MRASWRGLKTSQNILISSQKTCRRGLRANWRDIFVVDRLRANLSDLTVSWRGLNLLVAPVGYKVLSLECQQVRFETQLEGLRVLGKTRRVLGLAGGV